MVISKDGILYNKDQESTLDGRTLKKILNKGRIKTGQ